MRRISLSRFVGRCLACSAMAGCMVPVAALAQVAPVAVAPASAPTAPAAVVAAPAPKDGEVTFDLASALQGGGTPLSADQAASLAAKTAPSVARAEAASHKAEVAAEAANLAVYPRLELEARYTRLSDTTQASIPLPGGMTFKLPKPLLNQGLFEARVMYPVSTLFFSFMPRHRAAQEAAEAQKFQRQVELQSVALSTREAYYGYARARASLLVARSTLSQAEAHRRDVEALVNAGTLARVELVRSDAQVAAARVAVLHIESSVAVARSGLFSLMHMEGTQDVSVSENLEEPLPLLVETQDTMLAKALSQRSEIKALRLLSGSHEHSIDAFQGDGLPQFAVGGNLDVSDPNQRYSSNKDEWNASWAAFASITWSPNDLASAGKGQDQARADLAQTLADLQQLEDGLRVEVARAYEDYGAARAAMEASKAGIAAAEESFRVRREQFRAGAAVATDVIDAERDLRQARLDLVNAAIDGRVAKARLNRAVEAQ